MLFSPYYRPDLVPVNMKKAGKNPAYTYIKILIINSLPELSFSQTSLRGQVEPFAPPV